MKRRKKKIPTALISVIIAFIMISSILAVMLGTDNARQQLEFNGYRFVQEGSSWSVDVNGQKFYVNYLPDQLSDMQVDAAAKEQLLATKMAYVSGPVNGRNTDFIGLAQYELADFLDAKGIYPVMAIADNNTGYALPLITCDNSTVPIPVVQFAQGNSSSIRMQGSCVVIEASNGYDFLRLKDRLVLEMAGVM